MTTQQTNVGAFSVDYEITTGAFGAPTFSVQFVVDVVHKTVSGLGTITDTSNPPLDYSLELNGFYEEKHDHILVHAYGRPIHFDEFIQPSGSPATLTMKLDKAWTAGEATYVFRKPNHKLPSVIYHATVTQKVQATGEAATNGVPAFRSYRIGTNLEGATSFTVHLHFNKLLNKVVGQGDIFNDTPSTIHTYLSGNFYYMTIMPNITHIGITATGLDMKPGHWSPIAGIGPVILPNVQNLHMVLDSNWKSGVASFTYSADFSSQPITVENVPVHAIE